jgi:hypothetical protein
MIKRIFILVCVLLVIAAGFLSIWLYSMDFFAPVSIVERLSAR